MEVKKSKTNKVPSHPTFVSMVANAAYHLKYPHTSRPAIKKYVLSNYKLSDRATTLLNNAIKKGVQMGYFSQPKGPSGPLKLEGAKAKSILTLSKAADSLKKKDTPKKPKITSTPKKPQKISQLAPSPQKKKKPPTKSSTTHTTAGSHVTKKKTASKSVSGKKATSGTSVKKANPKKQIPSKKVSSKPPKKTSTAAKVAMLSKKNSKKSSTAA